MQNVSIAIVGKGTEFTILDEAATSVYLSEIEGDENRGKPTESEIVDDKKPPQDPPGDQGPADPRVSVAMDTE